MTDGPRGHRGRQGEQGERGAPGRDAPLVELTALLKDERRRWRSWFLSLVVVMTVVVGGLVWGAQQRHEFACDNRIFLHEIVAYVTADDGGGGLDLTAFPSFHALDPETQAWAQEITDRLGSGSGDGDAEFRAFVDELVPLDGC